MENDPTKPFRFELSYPNVWIDTGNEDLDRAVGSLALDFPIALAAAYVACEDYARSHADKFSQIERRNPRGSTREETWALVEAQSEEERARHGRHLAALGYDPGDFTRRPSGRAYNLAGRMVDRERWLEGERPTDLLTARMLISQAGFVSALDRAVKAVRSIRKRMSAMGVEESEGLQRAVDGFLSAFGDVKEARDSLSHPEERVVGEQYGRPIKNKAADIPGLVRMPEASESNFLHISTDGELHVTGATGALVKVTISLDQVGLLQSKLQAVIDELPWKATAHGPTWKPDA